MADRVAMRAVISGRVQGVYYRAWTREQAELRGLSGWVRNMPDRTVMALFVGPGERVAEMLEACREGPLDARVDDIATERVEPAPAEGSFRILD